MVNYTFIIPHKDNLTLLKRCIASIPVRDDIQIIVVDDHSHYEIQEFSSLPSYIDLFRLADDYGAGAARNEGLLHAQGKWILFADCDDYYYEGFLTTLDNYLNSSLDVVFFNVMGVVSDTGDIYPRYCRTYRLTNQYDESQDSLDRIRYHISVPYNKMVSLEFIRRYHITFENICKGNDTWYSFQVGYHARQIFVEKSVLYAYTYHKGSISSRRQTSEALIQSLKNHYKNNSFYRFVHYKPGESSIFRIFAGVLLYRGFFTFLRAFCLYVSNYSIIKKNCNLYVEWLTRGCIQNKEISWYVYQRALLPDIPPIAVNGIKFDIKKIKRLVIKRKAVLARWISDYDCSYPTEWWYCVRDTPIDLIQFKSKIRCEIKRGLQSTDFIILKNKDDLQSYISQISVVEQAVLRHYPEYYRPSFSSDSLKMKCMMAITNGGSVFICKSKRDNFICGYAIIYCDTLFMTANMLTLRVHPKYLNDRVSAGLVYYICHYYLNEMKYVCVSDGERNIKHETNFQAFLVKTLGFRYAYCRLNIVYHPLVRIAVKTLYPFRRIVGRFAKKSKIFYNAYCTLKMEQIRRTFSLVTT